MLGDMPAMTPNKWQDIPGVEISIPGRGESIVYRESGREYHFDICFAVHPYQLFTDSYWDGKLPVTGRQMTEEERQRLIPRLVSYMTCKGGSVEICEQRPPTEPPALSGRDVLEYRRKHGIIT
jgi:hypothetical protein